MRLLISGSWVRAPRWAINYFANLHKHLFRFVQNCFETFTMNENASTLNFHVKRFFQERPRDGSVQNACNIGVTTCRRFRMVQKCFKSIENWIRCVSSEKETEWHKVGEWQSICSTQCVLFLAWIHKYVGVMIQTLNRICMYSVKMDYIFFVFLRSETFKIFIELFTYSSLY